MYHCKECGSTITAEFVEGLTALQVGDTEVFHQQDLNTAHYHNEQYFHHEGICDNCYLSKYNDPENEEKAGTLISQMEVYGRNISNIISEDFRQDGAFEKLVKYETLIRRLEEELQNRPYFMRVNGNTTKNYHPLFAAKQFERTPVPDTPDFVFYFKKEWSPFDWKILSELPLQTRLKLQKARKHLA